MLTDLIEHGHMVRSFTLPKGPVSLHCMPGGAGLEQRENEAYSWDGLKRGPDPFMVIQHTIAGRGQLDYAGSHSVLSPGETMVLTFPHANRYWLARGDSWEYFWLVLNGREALRVARAVIDTAGPVLHLPTAAIDRLAEACLALVRGENMLPGEASAAAYGAMMALQDGVFGAQTGEETTTPQAVQRARHYIDAHLAEPVNVDRMARAAQVSRAHFVRQFTKAVGMPPSDFVFEQRMERASRLLLATDGAVGAIARACGFPDANYFAKAFRRHYGLSPTAYRAAGATLLPRRGADEAEGE
ncbi:AraC family transcriptional regulator [Devosia sp. H5989]|nr:AraC family transcriptional regulator [Devosia sp. H5989]